MKSTAFLLFALALTASAIAQTYKWVDKDGKVRYGDQPPPGAKASTIKGPAAPVAPPAAAPAASGKKGEKPLTPEQAFQKRQQDLQEAAQKAEKERNEAAVKKANCESAQASLRQIDSGTRISTVNAAGERVMLDDDQRAAERARTQKAVSEWCN